MSALTFTLLALALAGPVPAMLARASWTMRAPRAALVLWQSIAVAATLSQLEVCGGPNALAVIRSKLPAYGS